ncbi:LuxR C-terminal-related transcriptional regulator [Streptomyces sp. NPDC006733]|uniref:LuxR C-terminal-related transcriptional regulator n=1 Tax=Streptomyces sp. NPDC006733 TaxID=3155460 RepID=UPI0033D5AF59
MLAALGLDSDTEAVYRLMAARPEGWGVRRIAAHLGLDDGQVRDALDQLAALELLRQSVSRPGAWRAVSPEQGLSHLLRQRQDDLERRQVELAQSQAAVSRMIAECTQAASGQPRPDSERLVGIDAVHAWLERVADRAASSVCTFMPGGAQSPAALAAARHNDARILARDVSIRTVCLDSLRNSPPTLDYARWLTAAGGAVRSLPTLPLRMIVIDGTSALVPLDPAETRRGAVVLHAAGALSALTALFEQAWSTALPLGASRPRDRTTGLSAQERELLTLLAGGLTDEAAATRLGVSLSTVRRCMAGLMDRLGARSRFEAGLRAAERGWLLPPPRPAG